MPEIGTEDIDIFNIMIGQLGYDLSRFSRWIGNKNGIEIDDRLRLIFLGSAPGAGYLGLVLRLPWGLRIFKFLIVSQLFFYGFKVFRYLIKEPHQFFYRIWKIRLVGLVGFHSDNLSTWFQELVPEEVHKCSTIGFIRIKDGKAIQSQWFNGKWGKGLHLHFRCNKISKYLVTYFRNIVFLSERYNWDPHLLSFTGGNFRCDNGPDNGSHLIAI